MLTAEQLALRQQGVSGSEAAALVGLSRWATPIDIYQAKIDPIATQQLADMESPLIRGILFEEPVIKWYSLITQRTVHFPGTLRHPAHPRIFATPDGIAKRAGYDDRVLEVKNTTWHSKDHWGSPGTAEIDECYVPQVQFEMACAGLKRVDVCVYAGVEPAIYHVDYDDETFQMIREVCERFYQDHVVPRVPPPPDASENYMRYVQRLFPQNNGVKVKADADNERDLACLASLRAQAKELEARMQEVKNRLLLAVADNDGIDGADYSFTYRRTRDSIGYDYKRLVEDLQFTTEQLEPYKKIKQGHRRILFTANKTEG